MQTERRSVQSKKTEKQKNSFKKVNEEYSNTKRMQKGVIHG